MWFALLPARILVTQDSTSLNPRAMSLEKGRNQGFLPCGAKVQPGPLGCERLLRSVAKPHGHTEKGREAGCVSVGSRSTWRVGGL